MIIKIAKDWYDSDELIFPNNTLELKENSIYTICGCNGYGKSTIIQQIKEQVGRKARNLEDLYRNPFRSVFHNEERIKKENSSNVFLSFNNASKVCSGESDFYHLCADDYQLSLGERIRHHWGRSLAIFNQWVEDKEKTGKTCWFFFDDLDSGASIDMLMEFKHTIETIIDICEKHKKKYYIILAANSYELTHFKNVENICIDALTFEELSFKSYDDYKLYVISTRREKDKRYEKQERGE